MFDLPLHPIVVHFSIVLGIILPFAGYLVIYAVRKNWVDTRAWLLVVFLSVAYLGFAGITAELGEEDEDRVERVVPEKVIEEHEEAGEAIPWVAGVLLVGSIAGLVNRKTAMIRRAFCVLAFLAIIPLMNAGHTGGELVYKHGAAIAHLSPDQWEALKNKPDIFKEKEEKDHDDD